MRIKIVLLDNEKQFGIDVAVIISGLDENFFKDLKTPITGIEAIPITTPQEAFGLIKKGDISLLSLDIELDSNVMGDKEYENLFFDGTAVPCIVVSAVIDKLVTKQQVTDRGVSEIIQIARGDTNVAYRLAEATCRVLGDRRSKINQIQTYVNLLKVKNNLVQFNGEEKNVQQWIDSIIEGNHSPIDEQQIIPLLVRECVHQSRTNQDHNIGFKREN